MFLLLFGSEFNGRDARWPHSRDGCATSNRFESELEIVNQITHAFDTNA